MGHTLDSWQAEGGLLDKFGQKVGSGTVVIDASVFRESTEGIVGLSLLAGSKLDRVEWLPASNNAGSGTLNIGVEGDLDKFVDAASLAGTSGVVNVAITNDGRTNVRADASNVSDSDVNVLISVSASNTTRRGSLKLYFSA